MVALPETRLRAGDEPTRRESILAAAESLRRGGPNAVLLAGEEGSGRTYLLEAIVAEIADEVVPLRIDTGRSLKRIPYAALLPQLPGLTVDEVGDRVGVLRALWGRLHRASEESGRPVLLVVDDAQDLDEGSADLVAEAVASSWVRLLAAGTNRSGLPADFLALWQDGIAERIEVPPLTLLEAQSLAESRLADTQKGGRLSVTAARVLHRLSGGNPQHVVAIVDEARDAGTLVRLGGLWLLTPAFHSRGEALAERVRVGLDELTAHERESLTLVALTEPLPRPAARLLVPRPELDRLVEKGWIVEGDDAGLRMRSRLQGDAVRAMSTLTRRLHLYRRAQSVAPDDLVRPANELRLLELALDAGVVMSPADLSRGAATAVRRFNSELALRAAAMIDSEAELSLARGIVARAHVNLGAPEAALAALRPDPANPADVADLLAGSLVKFTVRLALGDVDAVDRDVQALEAAADTAGAAGGSSPAGAKEAVLRRARLLRALAAAERADFSAVAAALRDDSQSAHGKTAPEIERIVWSVLESEVQLAAGRYESAATSAGLALSARGIDDEHFPLTEHALVRYLAGTVLAGDWPGVERLVGFYETGHARPLVVFGPGLDCARSYVLLRQGRSREALVLVSDAAQNLDFIDPLQLRGLAWSFAAWAAAAIGRPEEARASLSRADAMAAVGSAAMRRLAALHRAGAREMLEPRTGLPLVRAMAEEDRESGRTGWELLARIIGFELGDSDEGGRGAVLAADAQGPWAAAWGAWARAESREASQTGRAADPDDLTLTADDYLSAGDLFRDLGILRRARAAYARAAGCLDALGNRTSARRAAAAAAACEHAGEAIVAGEREEAILASLRLSAREQDVVDLAVQGLTDRVIADRLHLSVRTVEGHLHRSYAKLGIRGRDELRDAVIEDRP
ncbi:hypothetical protein SCMU_13030 [Sinomonas cyclohexanicum]|uniref:HTH luxR-type domain-containing protein n=1 Tax=Sinomonas cyclohexanicum TaxID=322009 RepID=A0ABN6FFL5_SINCY|nr:AAA family ATPase [Corynebacterium cyclohexanicum]BCT75461.1 hypothetical protein SCMU_13030 [Corynebacterium cyclohexanicum]